MPKLSRKTKRKSSTDCLGQDSYIIEDDKVQRRPSLISSVVSWPSDSESYFPEPPSDAEIALLDEDLFYKVVSRDKDAEKYVIEKRLTSGGMGVVYFVYDRDFERQSAMKVILPELKAQSTAIENFTREARITSQLEHPNVIPVHDLGFLPGHGIFFTMKLVFGQSLNAILKRIEVGDEETIRKYDLFTLLGIFRKICDAVAFAHSKNILHRDIKPHNIMVGEYGEALLMDWGLAKRLDEPTPYAGANRELRESPKPVSRNQTTQIGIIKGSPAYMSPEQAYGDVHLLDKQADIFLLGATLYQIFTFFPPYLGDDIYEVIENARNHNLMPPEDLESSRMPLPEDMRRIIMKALARDKEDRYSTVEELAADIDAFLRGDLKFCHRTYKKGDMLMVEGEVGSESYMIVKGEVRVIKKINGKDVTINILTEGDIVGEMALITAEARSASVIAQKKTEVMVLSQELFTQHLTKLPPWLGKTIYLLAERLNRANIMQLSPDSADSA